MAVYKNLNVDQGADFSTDFTVEDTRSDPIDLTNVTVSGQIRRTYTSVDAFDFDISKTDAPNGEISIALSASTTAGMGSGRYVYDVFGTDTVDEQTFKILEGMVEVVPRVTRAE